MSEATLSDRLRLYLVADPDASTRPLIEAVDAAIRGGVSTVQLRAKELTDREATELAKQLANKCRETGVLFLVNDRVDIALTAEADGVHLGVDDLQLEDARRIAGHDFVIGYSPETDAQAVAAGPLGASYLGVGPVYGTVSKADAGEAIGLGTLQRRVAMAGIPVIGIGGISAVNAAATMASGVSGIAVVSAILGANDPETAAQTLRQAIDRA